MDYYEKFFRNFGIRRTEQLMNPPLPTIEQLQLPRASILHYVSSGQLDLAPSPDDAIFANITKVISMDHVTEIPTMLGNPTKMGTNIMTEVLEYHKNGRNRRFRRLRDLEAAQKDELALIVYNYGFINHTYRYPRSMYTEYYRWVNSQNALWENVQRLADLSPRQQFIRCGLPKLLPSLTDMTIGVKGVSQSMIDIFDSPEKLFLLELWKWFGAEPATSLLAKLNPVQAHKVNLVFMESGRWFVVNLGLLADWRKATPEELKKDPKANTKGIDAKQLQLRFLRLMMSLFETRTVVAPIEGDKPVAQAPAAVVVAPTEMKPVMNRATGKIELKPKALQDAAATPVVNDAPTETGADVKEDALPEKTLVEELNKLEFLSRQAQAAVDEAARQTVPPPPLSVESPEEGLKVICDRLAEAGSISGSEYKRYTELASTYRTLPSPDGTTTLEHFSKVDPALTKIEESPSIPDIPTVFDKTMLKSSLLEFDSKYIKHVFQKDVAGMVLSLQHAGVAITGYEVEEVENITGGYRDYTVRLSPIEGAASTVRFKLPIIDEEGVYRANGVNYKLRKQDTDLPIRKVAPDRVALTSYYGKTFVTRSEKRVNDYATWLKNAVMAKGLDDTDQAVVDLYPADVFDNEFVCPRLFSILASSFRGFTMAGFVLNFDHTKREKMFGKDALAAYEKDGAIVVGVNSKFQILVLGKDDVFYYIDETGVLNVLGTIESILHLDLQSAPVDFTVLKVLSRTIPVGVVLGYELGLDGLMKLLNVTPRRVNAGSRLNLLPNEYTLVFSDETLIFSRDDKIASMLLAGFNEYHKGIRQYSVYEFDRRAVYMNIMDTNGSSVRFLREIDLMYQLFIDPITKELLVEMNEPTTFRGLLLRSCEMLLLDQHPDENDAAFMRKRGYERMAGAVYTNLVASLRAHNGRVGKSKVPIELHPYAVWQTIAQDPSVSLVSEINPVQNLKETEAVTTGGTGGRSSRSMTKHTRAYHRNAMGVTSESTVDSSDVGINTYTSADPQFTSVRGLARRYKVGETGATALISTSALLSVGSDRDDPKRVNFIGIQNSHTVACNGYSAAPVRTGYEQVIAHRTGPLFATGAKKPGRVLSVSEEGIQVEYDDGEVKGYPIGRRFGAAAGLTIPHSIVTKMVAGQKFKAGDILSYNEGFFEPDFFNPTNVVWKAGVLVKTVLFESPDTLEDSSAISQRVAGLLKTKTTKVRLVKLNFEQTVSIKADVGQAVAAEDILCTIEDPVTAEQNLFDETSLDTLRILSAQTPLAKANGVVEGIEVYYHGEKEDMSPSLRALANKADKALANRQKATGQKIFTGSVDESFRVEGDPLLLDTLVIKFYITSEVAAGEGDKGVFGNQMKTVFGKILTGDVKTESGVEIDAIFGQHSIDNRIVNSPAVIGTTNTLLKVAGMRAVKAYRS